MEIFTTIHPMIYLGIILVLLAIILIQLIRNRGQKGTAPEVLEMMERQYARNIAQKNAAGENALAAERQRLQNALNAEKGNTENAFAELERQKEISRIAASISNEQAKKLVFFTDLAAEFHPPLLQIMTSLENILLGVHGRIQGKLKDELKATLRSARQLIRFMNQFHDISRLQTGKMELRVTNVDVVQLVRDIFESISWFAEKNKIELRVTSSKERIDAYCDREKIGEVLYHLLSNAFKFTPRNGKIAVHIEDDSPDLPEADDSFRLTVRNTGEAIPEEKIPYLFEMLPGPSTEHQKPRMGLSIVKELVSLHGGEIQVSSAPETGTRFSILIPKNRVSHMAQEEGSESRQVDLTQRARIELAVLESYDTKTRKKASMKPFPKQQEINRSLLIVEDNEEVRQLLRGGLEDFFHVYEATNGKEALETANKFHPDLIITDILMPEMDGLDFLREIKSDQTFQNIPIILLTARTEPEVRQEGLEAGASAYISKPFRFEELLTKIRELIRDSDSSKEMNEV